MLLHHILVLSNAKDVDLELEALFAWFFFVDDFGVELPVIIVVLSVVGAHIDLAFVILRPRLEFPRRSMLSEWSLIVLTI